jgi:hypothetical protein
MSQVCAPRLRNGRRHDCGCAGNVTSSRCVDRRGTRRGVRLRVESRRATALGGRVGHPTLSEADVQFAARNEFGVLDHVVRLPSGEAVYNPMRVIPVGPGVPRCEVVFTLRRRSEMTNEEFEADAAAVATDLETLRRLIEG